MNGCYELAIACQCQMNWYELWNAIINVNWDYCVMKWKDDICIHMDHVLAMDTADSMNTNDITSDNDYDTDINGSNNIIDN